MSITTKHKLYGCVLAAGLSVFVADKTFFSASDAAAQDLFLSDDAMGSSGSVLEEARRDLAAMADVPVEASNLADRLAAMAEARSLDLTDVRNAFKPAPSWFGDDDPSQPLQDLGSKAAVMFVRSHRLMAVMAGGPNGSAIIGDKCLFIGQEIDGFQLISVGARSAVLVSNGVRVELQLAQQQPKNSTD